MTRIVIGLLQMACSNDEQANVSRCESLVREAASRGANVVLPPELFSLPYFCKDRNPDHFALAREADGHPLVARFAALSAELGIAIPVSFFERSGEKFHNSVVMIDADGAVLGIYRKSHIPEGPGYEEKSYFAPGDTGFKVWATRFGRIGVGICWDQWFPESARAMALAGAEFLLYPTAIGSEPHAPDMDTQPRWRRVMQGHAVANYVPVCAANRVGVEQGASCDLTFYGSSFAAGPDGAIVAELDRTEEGVALATFDRDELARGREDWKFFAHRRPDLYGSLVKEES